MRACPPAVEVQGKAKNGDETPVTTTGVPALSACCDDRAMGIVFVVGRNDARS
jgi:hypothetical protein